MDASASGARAAATTAARESVDANMDDCEWCCARE
jgi:hypothetical protein